MTDETLRLGLPCLLPSQADKHVSVNEAFARLDALVMAAVEDRHRTAPPANPAPGQRHIVAAAASGAWASQSGRIAEWRDGGWVFLPPAPGWIAFVAAEGRFMVWTGAGWNGLGQTLGNAALPANGLEVGPVSIGQGGGALVSNLALGVQALSSNTTGQYNTAAGALGMKSVSTGSLNTAVGYAALHGATTGSSNTAVGVSAALGTTIASHVTAIGANALAANLEGAYNSALGSQALQSCVNGAANTALGYYALAGLSAYSNCTGVGVNAQVTGSNQVQIGDSATTVYCYGAVQNRSDARDKADVRDIALGLDFILGLRPVDFRWNYREDYAPGDAPGSHIRTRRHTGFLAQEVRAAADALGEDFGGLQDHAIAGGQDVLSLGYSELIAPLVAAVQALARRLEALEGA